MFLKNQNVKNPIFCIFEHIEYYIGFTDDSNIGIKISALNQIIIYGGLPYLSKVQIIKILFFQLFHLYCPNKNLIPKSG